jgi:hypothetical protein
MKMHNKLNFPFTLFLVCAAFVSAATFCSTGAWSEDPAVGRLPDGRAFRTDKEGNQLVDYIAELELEVESLKRRVVGLEDENAEKQASIQRLSSGRDLNPKVIEKDLIKKEPAVTAECKPQIVEKVVEKIVEKPGACLPQVKVVEKTGVCPPQVKCADDKALVNEITNLKEQLAQVNLDLSRSGKDLSKANQDLERANQALEQKSIDVDILANKLETQRKTAAAPPAIYQEKFPKPETDVRIRAVDMLRKTMLQDLRSFEDLVNYRNKLYVRVPHDKFPEPERVIIAELRQGLQSADQVLDLSRVRTQISEQRGKVQQEIALYKRELKIR